MKWLLLVVCQFLLIVTSARAQLGMSLRSLQKKYGAAQKKEKVENGWLLVEFRYRARNKTKWFIRGVLEEDKLIMVEYTKSVHITRPKTTIPEARAMWERWYSQPFLLQKKEIAGFLKLNAEGSSWFRLQPTDDESSKDEMPGWGRNDGKVFAFASGKFSMHFCTTGYVLKSDAARGGRKYLKEEF